MSAMIDTGNYGKALYQLARENGNEEQVLKELDLVCQALKETPAYITLLDTPAISTEEKISLLKEAFGDLDPMLVNFLCILCEKHSIYRFSACAAAYRNCYDEEAGIVRATAITAMPMQERQCAALREKLEKITGKQIVLTNRIDPALIGGITLRYGGVQLDDSIQSRLDVLRRSLNETIV